MKNIFYIFVLSIISCIPQEQEISFFQPLSRYGYPITEIKFDYYELDVGEVMKGEKIKYKFPFTNIGKYPLVIINCKSSCGCVVPYCPRKPILPNEKGIFEAIFDTSGKIGVQRKTITMIANIENDAIILKLKATIKEKNELD